MSKVKILIPMPSNGVDPSEVAIPWKMFSENNFEVIFATPNGLKATTDLIMLTGQKLGLLKPLLAARKDAVDAYSEMEKSKTFSSPMSYAELKSDYFDAIYLPGGHDKPVREYLESTILQNLIVEFFNDKKPVGAVCHGVVLVARSIDSKTQKSVLFKYNTTALLKKQELLGYNLTRLWLKDYYLTYPEITVEDEVIATLENKAQFKHGPNPILRDTKNNLKSGFVSIDRNYVSGRWPGDVYNLSFEFMKLLEK